MSFARGIKRSKEILMNLDEFVKRCLTDIIKGIKQAQPEEIKAYATTRFTNIVFV